MPTDKFFDKYTQKTAEAAAKGAKWMDQHCPDWAKLIDITSLNLAFGTSCIWGQTASCLTEGRVDPMCLSSYEETCTYLIDNKIISGYDFPPVYGFMLPKLDNTSARWEMLTLAWREEIRNRIEHGDSTDKAS